MNNDFDFTIFSTVFASEEKKKEKKNKNGYAIASLVFGIVSVFCCCCCCFAETLGLIIMGVSAILAIVFAFLSKKNNDKMDAKAIAGLVLGIIAIVMLLLFIVAIVGVYSMIDTMPQEELLAFIEETYKPMVDEKTYNELVEAIKSIYATREGQ
ncbi:MAG: DUF4190 domain-containing protein [Ruminococcaceae bacterium]|nr:DUF4190 domain-containing protein [Oscillospiraceae bacterium]